MTLAIISGTALALLLVWTLSLSATTRVATAPSRPATPLDEAERILTARYRRGAITQREFERMLMILRS